MASSQPIYDAKGEQDLMRDLWTPQLADNPLNFVLYAFPWGKANTPLAHLKGPREWQKRVLLEIAAYIKEAQEHQRVHHELLPMFKKAIGSGRGIGKSALFSWIALWLVSTRLGSSVWVTANGEPQLRSKTFPEISKWVSMAINAHWFDISATAIRPAPWFSSLVQRDMKIDPQYWYIAAQLWSEENPDAFAGAHNVYGECYLFDEASGIPEPIWTVARGVFTEQIIDRYWLAFSNPRRNDGAFHGCFHGEEREEWRGVQIDARTVEGIAQDVAEGIIKKHGPDSDEARVEVYGQFPNQADNQFIPQSYAAEAAQRVVADDPGAPLVLGVDVARGGKDFNVIAFRKGRDARVLPWKRFKGDTVACANAVAEAAGTHKVDAIFVDGNGVGGGVVDMLKSWKFRVIEVQAGSTNCYEPNKYKNKRAEMWGLMKEWLLIGAVPEDPILKADLCAPWYSYDAVTNQIVLESKEHMRDKRRLASPDMADALAMTFAQTIARNDTRTSRTFSGNRRVARDVDYDMFG